jgi:tRNA threonylcarbamoyl adenosine modification protein YjeE
MILSASRIVTDVRLSEADLVRWGERIGRGIEAPAFLLLQGTVGAGKSVLARAIAAGAGVEGAIPSPTFNLLLRYEGAGGLEIVHLDLYRIANPEELFELGWEELGALHEVVLVEWPERAGGNLPRDRWEIRLDVVEEDRSLRQVEVNRVGHPPFLPGFPVSLSRS